MYILIKANGIVSATKYKNGKACVWVEGFEDILEGIVELPPHGEAKDTDIAIRYIKNEMGDDFNETTTLDEKSYKEGMKRAIELIGYAPTVLEASNG